MADYILTKGPTASLSDAGGESWDNIANIQHLDSQYAYADIPKNDVTQWARGYTYNFNIPTDATITGIVMRMTRYGEDGDIGDGQIYLHDTARNPKGSNYTSGGWSSSVETKTYGGSTDLWGATWSVADINHPNFGIMMEVSNDDGGGSRQARIDYAEISIYYSRPDLSPPMLALGAF